ncbi:MAG: hypothetical protein H7281_12230 [Bacteriovorax sp.]|nr:hypothetical protein [Bacteriovorax sp.]
MKQKNNKGQSTIEFILTFTAAVGFIFLFLKMALNYTNGYMVHHATFMASRAYLVGDAEQYGSPGAGDSRAFEVAKEVFRKNLPEGLITPNVVLEAKNENSPDKVAFSVFVGIWVEFNQAFSLGFVGGKDQVVFRSESFLGREPTRAESVSQICYAIKAVTQGGCETQATLDDNGG